MTTNVNGGHQIWIGFSNIGLLRYNHKERYKDKEGQYERINTCAVDHNHSGRIFSTKCITCFHCFSFLEVSGIFGNRDISFSLNRRGHRLNHFSLAPHQTDQENGSHITHRQ
jgi:hypothetical protein